MILEELCCFVDDFYKVFTPKWKKYLLSNGKRQRNRDGKLSISEIMAIFLLFQSSGYRDFKHYYLQEVMNGKLKNAFPQAVSYTRFVSLIPRILILLCVFLQFNLADFDGLGFIDSTPVTVCHNKRIHSHKVFYGSAKLGKTTKGWFFWFQIAFDL